jgi:hypothetical protein
MENKKASIIYILNILKEETDESHFLKQAEIAKKVNEKYGISIERKAISRSLTLLEELGYDINKNKNSGYALFAREFDESEIQYLADAIFSSKSISGNEAQKLCDSLSNTLSKYKRKDFSYLNKNVDINRTPSRDVFYNINIISEAIKKKKEISFEYLRYDENGKLHNARDNWRMKGISPYYLVNNFGRYYLLGNYFRYENLTCLRVEFLSNIEIMDFDAKPKAEVLGKNFSISNFINDHVYIFGSEVVNAVIKIYDDRIINDLFDWFGKNVKITTKDNVKIATIKADEQAFFYWCLQYGHDLEVLSPDSLRKKVTEELSHMLERYLPKKE